MNWKENLKKYIMTAEPGKESIYFSRDGIFGSIGHVMQNSKSAMIYGLSDVEIPEDMAERKQLAEDLTRQTETYFFEHQNLF